MLDLALDASGASNSLWVATTATHINKWPIEPHKVNGFEDESAGLSGEEEGEGVTDMDESAPYFTKPIATILGNGCTHSRRERAL